MNEVITTTTIFTTTQPMVLIPLSSGSTAAVVYTLSAGDIALVGLLLTLVVLQVAQMVRA